MPRILQESPPQIVANGASMTLTLPAAPTPGNVIVFVVQTSGSPWLTVPTGAVLRRNCDDSGRYTDFYEKAVQAGDPVSYTFGPTNQTISAGRGIAYELVCDSGATAVFDGRAVSDAATDVTRTAVWEGPGTVAGAHLLIGAVGLGGTSGGGDILTAPFATRAPTPIDSGRLHVGTHTMTGTTYPTFKASWTTSRRCVAGAVAYGEGPTTAPPVSARLWTGTAEVLLQIEGPTGEAAQPSIAGEPDPDRPGFYLPPSGGDTPDPDRPGFYLDSTPPDPDRPGFYL